MPWRRFAALGGSAVLILTLLLILWRLEAIVMFLLNDFIKAQADASGFALFRVGKGVEVILLIAAGSLQIITGIAETFGYALLAFILLYMGAGTVEKVAAGFVTMRGFAAQVPTFTSKVVTTPDKVVETTDATGSAGPPATDPPVPPVAPGASP